MTSQVALRKESVDRNTNFHSASLVNLPSLSARRAWIEIFGVVSCPLFFSVALRKESVDRNLWWGVRKAVGSLSLSARRAWIEIYDVWSDTPYNLSLSARRAWIEIC